jgi:hypothetical protein
VTLFACKVREVQCSHYIDNDLMALVFFTNELYLFVQVRGCRQIPYSLWILVMYITILRLRCLCTEDHACKRTQQTQIMILLIYGNCWHKYKKNIILVFCPQSFHALLAVLGQPWESSSSSKHRNKHTFQLSNQEESCSVHLLSVYISLPRI